MDCGCICVSYFYFILFFLFGGGGFHRTIACMFSSTTSSAAVVSLNRLCKNRAPLYYNSWDKNLTSCGVVRRVERRVWLERYTYSSTSRRAESSIDKEGRREGGGGVICQFWRGGFIFSPGWGRIEHFLSRGFFFQWRIQQ